MRSIVPQILIWLVGVVVFALIGCLVTAHFASTRLAGNNDFIGATHQLQADAASYIFEHDGSSALHDYLKQLNNLFRGQHHLINNRNRDLTTDKDLSDLASRAERPQWQRGIHGGQIVLEKPATGGHYRLLVEISPPFSPWQMLPYFIWIFVIIVAIGYALAVHIVRPVKRLRDAVEQFGKGKLEARAGITRQDEFGQLGRAFDQMAQRIEALVIAERQLLQDISHELRSPLTRLRFAVDLARTSKDDSVFRRVNNEITRLESLVDQLLQLTRAEGDITARNNVDISLPDLISECVNDFQLEADAKACFFHANLDDKIFIRGDKELIRRAIDNILSNAVRHCPLHSQLLVDLHLDGTNAEVRIRDEGPGVPEHMLTEIFKPFWRVESDRNRNTGGLGLGLSIARRAIALHQGTITARNAHPGLEIVLVLPYAIKHA